MPTMTMRLDETDESPEATATPPTINSEYSSSQEA